MAKKTVKDKPEAEPKAEPKAEKSRRAAQGVAASIRKSMDEWHALVDAARAGETRRPAGTNEHMAYEGHDH